jgi:hypothetical protein
MRDAKKNSHDSGYKTAETEESHCIKSDYRTYNAESIRLPGETTIDKCIRIATLMRLERSNGNLPLDLPNPELPSVYDEIDTQTLKTYLRVLDALSWLEVAAIRTYRKSKKHALHRLYSNLEKESGISQSVYRDIRYELTLETAKFLKKISNCVLREPIYDPQKAPQSRRKMIRRSSGNVIILKNVTGLKFRKKKRIKDKQQSFKL